VTKHSTPIKPPKARKVAPDPWCWPPEYEDIDEWWALEAIRYGNGAILARYLNQVNEIDPRVRRGLAELLRPNSTDRLRLVARHRFPGRPTTRAKEWERTFIAAIVPFAKLLAGTDPIDAQLRRPLAEMLDPESHHPLRLDFQQRNRGRPPLRPGQINWFPLVDPPIENDAAMLIARRAKERRHAAKASGERIPPLKQLHDDTSRATFFRRLKVLSESGMKRPFAKGRIKNKQDQVF